VDSGVVEQDALIPDPKTSVCSVCPILFWSGPARVVWGPTGRWGGLNRRVPERWCGGASRSPGRALAVSGRQYSRGIRFSGYGRHQHRLPRVWHALVWSLPAPTLRTASRPPGPALNDTPAAVADDSDPISTGYLPLLPVPCVSHGVFPHRGFAQPADVRSCECSQREHGFIAMPATEPVQDAHRTRFGEKCPESMNGDE
jgi:hypothetical protein